MSLHRRLLLASISAGALSSALFGREAFAQNVSYTYDNLGRLKTVVYPDGTAITYSYDPAGNRTSVVQNPIQVHATLNANPNGINQGASSQLTWTTTNATGASIDNGVAGVTPVAGGSVNVSPTTTTTYTITATGAGGQATAQATVTVTPPPSGSFSANPTSIAPGATTALSWTSADATSASIDNGVGGVTPVAGGSIDVSPTATTIYTLTLAGPAGNTTEQVTVNVAPQATFAANPVHISQGASSALSWTTQNATSVAIDNGVGAVTPVAGGSVNVSPSISTTYTLTATCPGGVTTKQATVNVAPTFNETIQITGTGPVNLRTLANNAGYNGAENAAIVFQVASNVTLKGAGGTVSAAGGICIDTGTWPSSSYAISLTLQVTGKVYGGGGGGGVGAGYSPGSLGTVGGDAIYAQENLTVVVNSGGEVKAGGGGGGGGAAWVRTIGGEPTSWNGGGGGGGFPNGAGGAEGGGDVDNSGPGANGATGGGGAGGSGGSGFPSTRINGSGGAGGGAGVAGLSGGNVSGSGGTGTWTATNFGGGGQPGYAIRKNGKIVSVTNNGAIVGTQG